MKFIIILLIIGLVIAGIVGLVNLGRWALDKNRGRAVGSSELLRIAESGLRRIANGHDTPQSEAILVLDELEVKRNETKELN